MLGLEREIAEHAPLVAEQLAELGRTPGVGPVAAQLETTGETDSRPELRCVDLARNVGLEGNPGGAEAANLVGNAVPAPGGVQEDPIDRARFDDHGRAPALANALRRIGVGVGLVRDLGALGAIGPRRSYRESGRQSIPADLGADLLARESVVGVDPPPAQLAQRVFELRALATQSGLDMNAGLEPLAAAIQRESGHPALEELLGLVRRDRSSTREALLAAKPVLAKSNLEPARSPPREGRDPVARRELIVGAREGAVVGRIERRAVVVEVVEVAA